MKTILRISLPLLLLIVALVIPVRTMAASIGTCAPDREQASGAVYRICMPTSVWNGDLVIYAHGYVDYTKPVAIPEDQLGLPNGPSIPEIVNGLGFAFATTSYSRNGLAIREGIADVTDLVDVFTKDVQRAPNRVYLAGPSEGGIITALALEQFPGLFDGGLTACGPIGDFPAQINYWGDVRVVFDYFFPGLIPGSAISIPDEVIAQWETVYEPLIRQTLRTHPQRLIQLLEIANIPVNLLSDEETIDAIIDLLWYNAFATNNAIERLGGQPFDNQGRIYEGSIDDFKLNFSVARYSADFTALEEMETHYQTRGLLTKPLVAIHTIDPLIPLWHEALYAQKVVNNSRMPTFLSSLPLPWRYGHCTFSPAEVLYAFVVLVHKVTRTMPVHAEQVLSTAEQRQEFHELLQDYLAPETGSSTLYLPAIEAGTR